MKGSLLLGLLMVAGILLLLISVISIMSRPSAQHQDSYETEIQRCRDRGGIPYVTTVTTPKGWDGFEVVGWRLKLCQIR